MKTLTSILICLMVSFNLIGQNETKNLQVNENEANTTPPKFTGEHFNSNLLATNNLLLIEEYLANNLVYPDKVCECGIEGTELVSFTVTKEGNLTDFDIQNSICPDMDKEIIRVLKTTNGMWFPGYSNGKPVVTHHEISLAIGNCNPKYILERFNKIVEQNYAKANQELIVKGNPKKALRLYTQGIKYLPNDLSMLLLRGICYFELGNTEKAKKDWNRIIELGGIDPYPFELSEMEGYNLMQEIFAKKKTVE